MFHRPPVLHRPFFALRPPPSLARRIVAGTDWFGGVRKLAAERLHITLFILDDMVEIPSALVDVLQAVGRSIDCPPVEVSLDVASGSGRSVALRPALRNPGLAALHDRIAASARRHGVVEREGYRFAPHMTLGYGDTVSFSRAIAPIAWVAEELVLIDSHAGRTRHEVLGRWRLDGGAQLSLF